VSRHGTDIVPTVFNALVPYTLAPLCVACLALGAALACAAPRVPAHAAALEGWGGALLVIGLALLGAAIRQSS
jgi:hypothetical protein